MSKDYFNFKRFTVRQDKCAMKVCTDSCILGAITAGQLTNYPVRNILDIGAGTGLLSLMLAQKSPDTVRIDAIEIDEPSVSQMRDNFKSSPWNNKLNIVNADAVGYTGEVKYDLIISNPPFYENHLKGKSQSKTMAKHDTGLHLSAIPAIINNNIPETGLFFILIPFARDAYFSEILNDANLYITGKTYIRHAPGYPPFRVIIAGSGIRNLSFAPKELNIYEGDGYSGDFRTLMKDYYLSL